MPANASLMAQFVKQYGAKKAKQVYYAKANSDKKFAKAAGEMSVYRRGHPKK